MHNSSIHSYKSENKTQEIKIIKILAAFFETTKCKKQHQPKRKSNKKCLSKYLNGNFSYAPHGHIAIRSLLERDTFQFLKIFQRFVIFLIYETRMPRCTIFYVLCISFVYSTCQYPFSKGFSLLFDKRRKILLQRFKYAFKSCIDSNRTCVHCCETIIFFF